ncbi:MAG: hypothetical protein LUQ59_12640, partial [Methanothrix sp.]|nr:hypothetical protein [Methanothrix sp.]
MMIRIQRLILFLLVAALIGQAAGRAYAGDDSSRDQISAATASAINRLRTDISAAQVTASLTVARFVQVTQSADDFDQILLQAQQIGGPRWIDDQTCQIKLEISGSQVALWIVSVASTRPQVSPLPAAVLQQRLSSWDQRTFSATGTSVSAEKAQRIRPADGDVWISVDDDVRGKAVTAARQDAVAKAIEIIKSIRLSSGKMVGNAMQQPAVQQSIRDWLMSQPVTQLRFKDDLQVEMAVSSPPDELLGAILSALADNSMSIDQLRQ